MYLTLKSSICFPDVEGGDPVDVQTPTLNETTLLANEAEAFALEPVAITRRHKNQFVSKTYCIICKYLSATNNGITLLKPHPFLQTLTL